MPVCACTYEHQTGFDDIRFRIRRSADRRGQYTDWTITPVVHSTHIPGTGRTYIEHLGYEPARVTWTIAFDCRHHYHALLKRLMTSGTLTVLAGLQSLKGAQATYGNRVYERLDSTLLVDLSDTQLFVGGTVGTRATFIRTVDPVTREAVTA
jgi:hypothetical protein